MLARTTFIIQSVDAEGRFLYVNEAWRETLGYGAEDFEAGLRVFDIIAPESRAHCSTLFQKVWTGEDVLGVDAIFVAKDGRRVHLLGDSTLHTGDGAPVTRSIFRDITRQRETEREALGLRNRLEAVFNVLEEGVAIMAGDGEILSVNPSAEIILRVPARYLIGKKLLDLPWTIVATDGAPMAREDHPALRTLRDGTPSGEVVVGMSNPSAPEVVWVSVTARPLDLGDEGGPAVVASFRDVTDRQQALHALRASEHRFATLAEEVPVGIFGTDPAGFCTFVNRQWCEMTGMSAARAAGFGWAEALHPDDRERIATAWQHAAETGEPFEAEYRYLGPSGETVWVVGSATALEDEHGQVIGYLGSVTDITERKAAEDAKEQLIALVSHEIRNPLGAVLGGLKFLGRKLEDVPAGAQTYLDMATQNAQFLLRMTTDLLDVERLESGVVQLSRAPVAPALLASQAITALQASADERGITLDAAATDEPVLADADRIVQVLINLIGNAVKFSPDHAIVRIEAEPVGDVVRFTVVDHGRGIPADKVDTIFERFKQVRRSDATEQRGAGLGLAICRAIVRQHDGRIWVESEEGKGSRFVFELPRA